MNTILFDLDGTLLPMDINHFLDLYFHNMGKHFYNWTDPKLLAKKVLQATEVMIQTNDGRTNEDIFMEHFDTLIEGDIDAYKEHFTTYYETLFANVQASTNQSKEMIEAVQILKEKGYTLVIATNPLFPYRANIHRINWAGLNPEWFTHITSFEENRYSKPYPEFFQEVLDKIGKQPEECMMVGNDVFDDLPAAKLGISTYLLTDCLINTHDLDNTADYTGSYKDFLAFVKQLPHV
ncbi:HAD family hydrolase [Candidatus Xianfuyuplasma coldseepsis]|uniref:HAD family hydrolase n=1 Tax=Candidatus Xianfuyuplasma coldseepsis TaxID=2782163 RepID=A0A7L7KRQ6_9MOLU|nr:HAD family hydrolase [Xianfuyuplasma coldseepsis]QMS85510.1 HAD family hydrolase [Xianfuyuplasma coldseepsis]